MTVLWFNGRTGIEEVAEVFGCSNDEAYEKLEEMHQQNFAFVDPHGVPPNIKPGLDISQGSVCIFTYYKSHWLLLSIQVIPTINYRSPKNGNVSYLTCSRCSSTY